MFFKVANSAQESKFHAALNTDEASMKKNVQTLIQWLEKQSHLPNVKDENLLRSILYVAKNDIQSAKNQIEKYYTARSTMPTVFSGRDPAQPWFKRYLDYVSVCPLPELTPEGHRILLYTTYEFPESAELPTAEEVVKGCQMATDAMLKDDRNHGVILLFDSKYVNAKVGEMLVDVTRKLWPLVMTTLEFQASKIIFINVRPEFEPCIAIFKSMLPKEAADQIIIWEKKQEDLVEILPKACLPSTYGGDLKPREQIRDDFYNYMRQRREWFLAEENVKADLSKKII